MNCEYIYRWWMRVERPRMIEMNGHNTPTPQWRIE